MAEGITARIDSIKKGVELLALEARKAANDVSQISTRLKFDPNNVNYVVERFTAWQKELDATNKKIEGLKKAQADLREEASKITGTSKEEKEQLAEIEKLASQYASDLQKAEANADRLNQLLTNTNKSSQIINTVTRQINEKYDIWLKVSQKIATATQKIYNSLKNVVSEASETGVQLSATAKRYNTTAEDIQTWDRALQLATGQSELFTQSLSVMVKGMAQIAAGRGVAFTKALKNIGIAYKDIKDLSAGEQFERIIDGLASVENYSQRAAAAQQLFGESGQYIASVLNDGGKALDGYKEKAESFGIISNSNAEALAEMNIKLEQAKSQITEAKAALALALQPALEVITELIRNVLVPAIKTIADMFKGWTKTGQGLAIALGILLLIIPKFIKGLALTRIALMSVKNGAIGATAAVTALKIAIGGIAAVGVIAGIMGIAGAFSSVEDSANDATDAIEEFYNVGKNAGIVGAQAQVNTESTATSLTTKDVNIAVEIHGYGDTEVSDDGAVMVAQLTADEVQKAWGELTK